MAWINQQDGQVEKSKEKELFTVTMSVSLIEFIVLPGEWLSFL